MPNYIIECETCGTKYFMPSPNMLYKKIWDCETCGADICEECRDGHAKHEDQNNEENE